MVGVWCPAERHDLWQWNGVDCHEVRVAGKPPPCAYNLMWDARMQELVISGASSVFGGHDDGWPSVWVFSSTPATGKLEGEPCGQHALRLASFGAPALGNGSFAVDVRDGPLSAPLALLVGSRPANIALTNGCTLLVDPASTASISLARTSARGRASFPLPVPSRPMWRGVFLHLQAVALDTGTPSGIATSGRLLVQIGD
jgi:hypothetical protein